MASSRMLWGRIALGGFLVEAVLIAISAPVFIWVGETPVLYIGVIGSLVVTFLFGAWVARRVASRHMLHGLLVGVVAMLIYMAMFELGRRFAPPEQVQPQPLLYYVVGHGFKLLGGALGGLMVERRQRQRDGAARARAVTASYGN